MSSETSIQKVTLVGASGNLGHVLLSHLLNTNLHTTILQRASSKSTYPSHPNLTITTVDSWSLPDLTGALRGQHAVIAAFPLRDLHAHLVLAEAAYASETVTRFIPADYGSVDARSARARELVPLFGKKVEVRELLEKLSENSSGRFSWTSLVNGHFFDWGLTNGFLHFYPFENPTPRAHILGSGDEKSSQATLGQVSKAVVRILTGDEDLLEKTRNKVLMLQSFLVSQNEVVDVLEKVTGKKYKREYVDAEEYIRERKKVADEGGEGAAEAIEDLVFALGVVEGDWTRKEEFSMELLGLEEEDLKKVVKKALQESEEGRKLLAGAGAGN
ncbi:hypothetical protein SMACR_07672 [Sordaria macrospora]|uniref:WGS project CABT00000000 data, contig 2.27 n=2 Tax=Sordaria macrospora TaxID=5147 RepID=F7W4H7_SORMK|nr:uncharacterized protein SMAC_07672 [Sordaria macrospora k-hell]KAA8634861.1 hypothetical protein SMACR_07672 [Sordaria macrospora]KAH7635496.1 hypothetical protein B0T09DRAFT_23906 [Sordaria sp. MPI-SDFR-AT-0083]WPJ67428.1 hypothetical protein SMAC4_07672 [Sordaria macrospora]CCC14930.1 unnamed protein product [Sordaria macrospora k-hell]